MSVENLITVGVLILSFVGTNWFHKEYLRRQKILLTLVSLKHHSNMIAHLHKYYVHILPIEMIMNNNPVIQAIENECSWLLAGFSEAMDTIRTSPVMSVSTEQMDHLNTLFERSDIVISEIRKRFESLDEAAT